MKYVILAATACLNLKRKKKMYAVLSFLTTAYFFYPQGEKIILVEKGTLLCVA